jgi:hypothetical protein
MKLLTLSVLLAALGLTLVGTSASKAQAQYPWCLRVVADDYSVDRCEYRSFEACSRDRVNEGAKSSCIPNPAFRGR